MGLVDCPDCHKNVSDTAPSCIHCGRPMSTRPEVPQTVSMAGYRLEGHDCLACKKQGITTPLTAVELYCKVCKVRVPGTQVGADCPRCAQKNRRSKLMPAMLRCLQCGARKSVMAGGGSKFLLGLILFIAALATCTLVAINLPRETEVEVDQDCVKRCGMQLNPAVAAPECEDLPPEATKAESMAAYRRCIRPAVGQALDRCVAKCRE